MAFLPPFTSSPVSMPSYNVRKGVEPPPVCYPGNTVFVLPESPSKSFETKSQGKEKWQSIVNGLALASIIEMAGIIIYVVYKRLTGKNDFLPTESPIQALKKLAQSQSKDEIVEKSH